MFGGNANNGANAGFVYANSNNVPSDTNANIGSRLYFSIHMKETMERRPRLLAKNILTFRKVLVGTAVVWPTEGSEYEKQTDTRMKRIGNLYKKIISLENLELADRRARKGKADTYGVRVHDRHREEDLLKLHDALLTKTFRTSKYEVFTIREPKERLIYRLPYYPDRIVHHAIMNVLEPIWTRTFTGNTFSCVKKRGISACARHVERTIRKYDGKPLYCLKIDIRKFYPSIDHEVLKGIIRRKIKDKDLLWLLDEIIDSVNGKGAIRNIAPGPDGEPMAVAVNGIGIPIGNYISQFLANLFMCYMLHEVNEERKIDCEEYADDFVFYSESKERLRSFFKGFLRPYIESVLRLEVKGNWQIFPIAENRYDRSGRGLDFVGFVFYRRQKSLRKSIKKRFCRRVSRLNKLHFVDGKGYKIAVAPWLGWARHSDSRNLLRNTLRKEYYETILS